MCSASPSSLITCILKNRICRQEALSKKLNLIYFKVCFSSCTGKFVQITQRQRKLGMRVHSLPTTVLQLSWLERHTDNVEVGSSNLPGTTLRKTSPKRRKKVKIWGISSVGQSTCFASRGSTVRIRYSPLCHQLSCFKLSTFNYKLTKRSLTY